MGVPRILLFPRPSEWITLDDKLIQVFQWHRVHREIWMDGRVIPEDFDPGIRRWLGYSAGRWEGNTLVVETAGYEFDGRTWLDSYANPHSDALRLVERWRRTAYDTLGLDMILHDPKIYTSPVVVETKTYTLVANREIQEVFCAPADEGSFNERIRNPAGGLD